MSDYINKIKKGETEYDIQDARVDALQTEVAGKQEQLTAGDNITIENNVISASGGGGGTQLYKHTITINYGEDNSQFVLKLVSNSSTPLTNQQALEDFILSNDNYISYIDIQGLRYDSENHNKPICFARDTTQNNCIYCTVYWNLDEYFGSQGIASMIFIDPENTIITSVTDVVIAL